MDNLLIIARGMLSSWSINKYDSFKDKKKIVESNAKWIEYDSITLTAYEHNLSHDEYMKVYEELGKHIKLKQNREQEKARVEYCVLLQYLRTYNIEFDVKVIKTERPDFEIIWRNERYGIEITRLAPEIQFLMHSLAERIASEGYSKRAINEFRKQDIHTEPLGKGHVVYQKNPHIEPLENDHVTMIKRIICKICKYCDTAIYDKQLIILGDAQSCLSVQSQEECNELLQQIEPLSGMNIAILFDDSFGPCVGHKFPPIWRES